MTTRREIRDSISGHQIAYTYPAKNKDVRYVHGHAETEWVWLRLANGDLCLATFPQEEAYLALEGTFQ